MGIIVVRDDDPNATTRPERLERVYAPLFDAGIPVNFSVVPEVALDVRRDDGRRELFLDESAEDCDSVEELTDATPLAAWLRRHEGAVDVFVHGLSHRRLRARTEFGALDQAEAALRIERGISIMERALGRRPVGFVPPWDALSAGAVRAATEAFDLISTAWVDRHRLPFGAWPAFVIERLGRREALKIDHAWLLRHRGGKLTADTRAPAVPAIVEQLTRGADVAVIVLHHWMFWEKAEPHPVIVALARALRSKRTVTVRDAVRYLDSLPMPCLHDLARGAADRLCEQVWGAD
jgi:peptidoglycan/xylan/chitin deacetylase (PgdA/CDA1 family)